MVPPENTRSVTLDSMSFSQTMTIQVEDTVTIDGRTILVTDLVLPESAPISQSRMNRHQRRSAAKQRQLSKSRFI